MNAVTPIRAACALFGFLLLTVATAPALSYTFGSHPLRNDFLSFYTGASLLPRAELYDYNPTFDFERSTGLTDSTAMVYIRLPFYALLSRPLARLRYETAYLVFQVGSLLSFGLALALWRRVGAGACLLLAGWSAAMALALLRGQDIAFVLLFASAAAALLHEGHDFSAGAVLALGLIKWNLLLIIPLLILAKRMTRFGLGFASGAGALLILSFAAYPGWPLDYWRALQMSETTLHVQFMPNLRALLYGVPGALGIQMVAVALGVVLCWCVFRSASSVDEALATALLAGVVLNTHDYAYDCVLTLPAILVAAPLFSSRPNVQACVVIGFGICPALVGMAGWRVLAQLAFVGLFLGLSTAILRRGNICTPAIVR